MITSKHLNAEIKRLELVADEKYKVDNIVLMKSVVKGLALLLKVMRDIKTNQVQYLRHLGVELIKPTTREEDKKDTK